MHSTTDWKQRLGNLGLDSSVDSVHHCLDGEEEDVLVSDGEAGR